MCLNKLTKAIKRFAIWLQDRQVEKRIHEALEEKEYYNSTKPNESFQIKKTDREKVVRLIEFKFAFIAFFALIVSLLGVDLARLINSSSLYLLGHSLYILLATGYIIIAVLITFIANREIDDLVLNKSYILITIEILSAIFIILGLLVEGIIIFDIVVSSISIVPLMLGTIYLFSPVRMKKKKNKAIEVE